MTDLIHRLESATEGSRELSDEVLLALGWKEGIAFPDMLWPPDHPGEEGGWDEYESRKWRESGDWCPDPTRNLQDAVDLVPEGWRIFGLSDERHFQRDRGWAVGLDQKFGGKVVSVKECATPALALSAAILRARKEKEE